MKKCEMLVTTPDGPEVQEVAVVITLDNGKVTMEAKNGHEIMTQSLMKEVPATNVEKWFNSLPRQYTGSMVRARMLG